MKKDLGQKFFIKTRKMEENINNAPKATYEELEERLRLAINEIMRLRKGIEDLSDNRGIQRLEFLFKVVDNPMTFSDSVTTKAIKEIEEALFPVVAEDAPSEEVSVENE